MQVCHHSWGFALTEVPVSDHMHHLVRLDPAGEELKALVVVIDCVVHEYTCVDNQVKLAKLVL